MVDQKALLKKIIIGCVVVVALGTLTLFAIPIIRNAQPPHGWSDQVLSSLKNAATAQESYCTQSLRCYTNSVAKLRGEGLRVHSAVNLTVVEATRTYFCVEGRHDDLPGQIWSYDNETGEPREGACPTR